MKNVNRMIDRASRAGLFRMSPWWIVACLTSIGVLALSPHQLGVVLAKVNIIAIAAVVGYWVDRAAFSEHRISPHSDHEERMRRAVIISASMIAMALAL